MKEIRGLLDYTDEWSLPTIKIFTGNNTITKDGRLVMGRGAAKQVRDHYRGIDRKLGEKIQDIHNREKRENYNFTLCDIDEFSQLGAYSKSLLKLKSNKTFIIGILQVKQHYSSTADIDIIRDGVQVLNHVARSRPNLKFEMNYPGIGYGNLKIKHIRSIVNILPDNVTLYR